MAVTAVMSMREQNARRFLGIAATLGVVGVAFNLNSDDSTLPKVIAAAAVVALIWSIHRFGRLGPDEAIVFAEPEAEAAPKKKKKKKKRAAEAADESSSNDGM
jgi:uncharacterized membrane protein